MPATPSESWTHYAVELGLNLARARHAAGYTQSETAHAAGITEYMYRQLEHGQSRPNTPANPRLLTLFALAEVLHIPLGNLLPPEPPSVAIGAAAPRTRRLPGKAK